MNEQTGNRAKLGLFVIIATTFLIIGLYYIGSKKNIFHSTISVSSSFSNVEGLLAGNNVRFNGINVGTVTKVYAVSDSTIKVIFNIDKEQTKYIYKSVITSIGTDGLLGNKLIEISPGEGSTQPAVEGDILKSVNPMQMDKTISKLSMTNDNLFEVSEDLKYISKKIVNNKSLWHLLADSVLSENIRMAVVKFKFTGDNTALITGDLRKIVSDIKAGNGSVGAILNDTLFSHTLNQTIVTIKAMSDTMAMITGDFKTISTNLKNGKGALGALLSDTTLVTKLKQTMTNVEAGSNNFNEDMQALKLIWPFKKYFKQKSKVAGK